MSDKNLIELFFDSKKNANCILKIEKGLLSEDENCILSNIELVEELFVQIFEKKMLHNSVKDTGEEKFQEWLLARYDDFVNHLLDYLSHSNKEIQIKSLETLLKFIISEAKTPLVEVNHQDWFFPKLLFEKIINRFTSDVFDQHKLIKQFKQYSSYVDIRFYTLKAIGDIFSEKEQVNDVFLLNCFHLLASCSPTSEDSLTFLSTEGIEKPFVLKEKNFKKLFSSVWGIFLKYELPMPLLKKVLIMLPNKVMSHFLNPYLLTDFFTDLYSKGGLTSLLALGGLFELIQKYNVEYPDFYLKLYSLFEVNIIKSSFNPRFFYLSNLFLSSTHLPAYLVAAFAKRLSRITLAGGNDCLLKILTLIYNLLIRHPTLIFLIHRSDIKELSEDPYDFAAIDPAKSSAMESSLWEIKSLQAHTDPEIVRKAKMINVELPKLELDFSSVLYIEMGDILRKERKRKFDEASTTLVKPLLQKNMFSTCKINSFI